MDTLPDTPTDADAAAARMQAYRPSPPGWRWCALPAATPGWYQVWEQGRTDTDALRGAVTFLGPGDLVLVLSANPLIHGFAETEAVLTELGTSGLTDLELAEEIARRTTQNR